MVLWALLSSKRSSVMMIKLPRGVEPLSIQPWITIFCKMISSRQRGSSGAVQLLQREVSFCFKRGQSSRCRQVSQHERLFVLRQIDLRRADQALISSMALELPSLRVMVPCLTVHPRSSLLLAQLVSIITASWVIK
jgi:hypothetical protein